ncbi:hypothetical protein KKE06_02720 [Candidatus Micrarchaeota archaeon]|nr:hypothetical protein [Candidatus Micrarchaeota archaeon]MBU1930826.1 hypothetical protein [Candidatus Micrarchaeota archaeon]
MVQNVVSFRKRGISYKKIARLLKLSSSSVHKYAKTIQLSKKKKQMLKQNGIKNQQAFVSRLEKRILTPCLNADFANLLGHLFFDGSVFCGSNSKFCLSFTNASKKAIDSFLEKINSCFGLGSQKIYKTNGKNVDFFEAQIYSKKAYFFYEADFRNF